MKVPKRNEQEEAVEVSLGSDDSHELAAVEDSRPVLLDLEGNDAMSRTGEEIKYQVQKFSTAALPAIFSRALSIALKSKNERFALEAMKLVKEFSSGKFSEKAVEGVVKKMSDDEILAELEGKDNN